MSDQGMFQRNINSDGAAAQSFDGDGDIDSTSSVVAVDTTDANVTVSLPSQLASAGMTITVVKPIAANDVIIVVQTGDSLDGVVDAPVSILAAAGAYASLTFVSTGASWANIG